MSGFLPLHARLIYAVLAALLIHGSLFLLPAADSQPVAHGVLSASLVRRPVPTKPAKPDGLPQKKQNIRDAAPARTSPEITTPAEASAPAPVLPLHTIYRVNELDQPLNVIGDLEIEPPEGFPEGASGVALLSLLIGEDGKPRWLGVESSSLPPDILARVVEKFSAAQFSQPQKGGKPIRALIKMEVNLSPEPPPCDSGSAC